MKSRNRYGPRCPPLFHTNIARGKYPRNRVPLTLVWSSVARCSRQHSMPQEIRSAVEEQCFGQLITFHTPLQHVKFILHTNKLKLCLFHKLKSLKFFLVLGILEVAGIKTARINELRKVVSIYFYESRLIVEVKYRNISKLTDPVKMFYSHLKGISSNTGPAF